MAYDALKSVQEDWLNSLMPAMAELPTLNDTDSDSEIITGTISACMYYMHAYH